MTASEETGKLFAIEAAIAAISESDGTKFRDGEIAETVHCMTKTQRAPD